MKKILFGFILIAMCAGLPLFAAKKDKKDAPAKQEPAAKTESVNVKTKFAGKRIAVVEPTMQFGEENDKWIPLFVQGQVTTNLQNFSDMNIIDRQNIDKAIKEQKLGTSAAYSEENQIEIGKLMTAQYIVVISIIKKGGSYALDAKINNAETNQTVGKAYSNPNCPASKLEDGSEINELSYNLLAGLGVAENALSALKNTAKNESQQKEISANANLAKGLALEKSESGSIVEAMAYYQKAMSESNKIAESAVRLNAMTSNLSTGNIRERTLKEIQARKEWEKIWDDYRKWADENYHIEVVYSTELVKYGKIYFEDEYEKQRNDKTREYEDIKIHEKDTQEIEIPVAIITECEQLNNLYARLIAAYNALPYPNHVKNWNLNTNRVPEKYFSYYIYRYGTYIYASKEFPFTLICSIYNENGNKIGGGSLSGSFQHKRQTYSPAGIDKDKESYCAAFCNLDYVDKGDSSNRITIDKKSSGRMSYTIGGVDSFIIKIPCKAEDMTDTIAIKVEVEGVPSIAREDNRKSELVKNLPDFEYSYLYDGEKKIHRISSIKKNTGGWLDDMRYTPDFYVFTFDDGDYYPVNYTKLLHIDWNENLDMTFGFIRRSHPDVVRGYICDLYDKLLDWETASQNKKKSSKKE